MKDLLSTLSIVAKCYSAAGNYRRGAELYTKALAGRKQIRDPNAADSLVALARISVAEKDYRQASNLLQQSLGQREKSIESERLQKELELVNYLAASCEKGVSSTEDPANCLQQLAAIYRTVGEEAIAADLLMESIDYLDQKDPRAQSTR